MQNQYLYHYGVKGMRWGVRKSRDERRAGRLKRYQSREIGKIERRREKGEVRESKSIDRRQKRYTTILDKEGKDSKSFRAESAKNAYTHAKARKEFNSQIAKKEIEKISKMKYSDMQNEKYTTYLLWGRSGIVAMGPVRYSSILDSGQMRPWYINFSRDIKTINRVDAKSRSDIHEKAYEKASKEIKR